MFELVFGVSKSDLGALFQGPQICPSKCFRRASDLEGRLVKLSDCETCSYILLATSILIEGYNKPLTLMLSPKCASPNISSLVVQLRRSQRHMCHQFSAEKLPIDSFGQRTFFGDPLTLHLAQLLLDHKVCLYRACK
jgi:hypothetical protein